MTRRKRLPNPHSPVEVRRAIGTLNEDVDEVSDDLEAFAVVVAATYVPYTGAHTDVDLGSHSLTTTGDVFINELTATDDVNAVNGVFSGDVSAMNGIFSGDVSCVGLSMTGYVLAYPGADADGEILYWSTADGNFQVGDHGDMAGLGDDDHPQYLLADGTRDVTGVMVGVDPTDDTHLATKGYTDGYADAAVSTHESTWDHDLFGVDSVAVTNGDAATLTIGMPVYMSASGTVTKAQADAIGTARVAGLMVEESTASAASGHVITGGILSATAAQWDAIAGTSGGLTAGAVYYLSSGTAGYLTSTAPSSVGEFVVKIGVAESATELIIRIDSPIGL